MICALPTICHCLFVVVNFRIALAAFEVDALVLWLYRILIIDIAVLLMNI